MKCSRWSSPRLLLPLALFASLPACRTDSPLTERKLDAILSGDRLRATWLTADGELALFVSFYDLDLQAPCQFQSTTEGYRCIPEGASVVYLDAACSQRAMRFDSCGTQTNYGVEWPSSSDCAPPDIHVYEAGGVAAQDVSSAFVLNDKGECVSTDFGAPATLYEAGDEIALSDLVEGTLETEFPGGRPGLSMLRGEDGSQQLWGVEDLELEMPCNAGAGFLNSVCAPAQVAYLVPGQTYHADADCSGPQLAYTSTDCYQPLAIEEFVESVCGFQTRYREIGPEHIGTLYRTYDGGMTCEPEDTSVLDLHGFERGVELPLSALMQTTGVDLGSGRLRGTVPGTEDGLLLAVPTQNIARMHDTELDTACNVAVLSDNSTRCVPVSAEIELSGALFADAACTEPLVPWFDGGGSCDPVPDYVSITELAPNACRRTLVSLHDRGPIHTGPLYFGGNGTPCADAGGGDPSATYYTVGSEIALTSLARLTLETQ